MGSKRMVLSTRQKLGFRRLQLPSLPKRILSLVMSHVCSIVHRRKTLKKRRCQNRPLLIKGPHGTPSSRTHFKKAHLSLSLSKRNCRKTRRAPDELRLAPPYHRGELAERNEHTELNAGYDSRQQIDPNNCLLEPSPGLKIALYLAPRSKAEDFTFNQSNHIVRVLLGAPLGRDGLINPKIKNGLIPKTLVVNGC